MQTFFSLRKQHFPSIVIGLGVLVLALAALWYGMLRTSTYSIEAGFVAFSPNGAAGGAIIPASCELGDYHDDSYYGQTCTSGANVCGMVNSGTYQCGQVCSASTPSDSLCAPTATLSANPSTIDQGESSTLTWGSSQATSCVSAGGFSTGGATSGSVSTGDLSTTSNYQVTCSGNYGAPASAFATVTVLVPTVSISVNPNRVTSGGSVTVTWNATNVNSCVITRNGTTWQSLTANGSRVVSGSAANAITSQTNYVMTCSNNGGASAATANIVANIVPGFQEF